MKIGILTYHRAENYGAVLQAYALLTYLRSLGHEVSFVDYWPQYHQDYFKLYSWSEFKRNGIKGKLGFIIRRTLWFVPRFVRKKRFGEFMHEKLELPKEVEYDDSTSKTKDYDVVVYGSDQIWRKQNLGGVGFDSWYFGSDNICTPKRITYAASMGSINSTPDDDAYVKKMMANFNSISVREADLRDYLKQLGVQSQLVIDPVFLLSKNQWQTLFEQKKEKGRYILFYNLLNSPESKNFAERLSQDTGLSIKELNKKMSLNPTHFGQRYISTAKVGSFLQMINDAEYVVSNSFHGVAFSVIFKKQFFAVGMRQKANRVVSLLDSVGISERYISDYNATSAVYMPPINYSEVNEKLRSLIGNSEQYLIKALKNEI